MEKKYYDSLEVIENYGLLSLPINEFSMLLAIDLLSQRVIEIPNAEKLLELEYEEKDHYKPLIDALQTKIKDIEIKITNSIEKGEIKALFISRNFHTEQIDTTNTLIKFDEFDKFLEIYGLDQYIIWHEDESQLGARFERETDIAYEAVELIRLKKRYIDTVIDQAEIEKLRQKVIDEPDTITKLIQENLYFNSQKYLGEEKSIESSKPLIAIRERETLLIIISALAKEAGIDINKISKAGVVIESLTQQLGSTVSATTIERHLKQIPQALENRTK